MANHEAERTRLLGVAMADVHELRTALAAAVTRLDRLGDGAHMTEWSRSGEAGENRYRCEYAREGAAEARAVLERITGDR
jgi:hypothetical protein